MSLISQTRAAFELKGSLFTLTVLHLLSNDLESLAQQLEQQAQQTPNLFKNMPVVIDLQRVGKTAMLEFNLLQQYLRQHGLIPVGVRNASPEQLVAARAAGLAILASQTSSKTTKPKPATATTATNASSMLTQVITSPVRSGQQVYARGANLVILASVNHGAEVLADGHIHVYGPLAGRALAGITGDTTARIFCQKLDAELISIAGYYRLSDDLPTVQAPMVQVYLENEKLCVGGLMSHE
jgi:septum site-determining protein MinC